MALFPENRLIAWGTVAATLLTSVGMVVGGTIYVVRLHDDAAASTRADSDHEGRLRTIESVVSDVRGDVRETRTHVEWIRRYLDRQPAGPGEKEPAKTASN